jgi:ABC-type sugar transport system permease subunit
MVTLRGRVSMNMIASATSVGSIRLPVSFAFLRFSSGQSARSALTTGPGETEPMRMPWHWTPLVTLTLIAALVSLPPDPFEQAQFDGADKWQIFWHITMPMIRPAILATVFIRLMDALRTVDEIWMLTGGGPGAATRYVGLYIWRIVFPKTDYGYGSAISVIVLYLTIVICWLLYVALIAPRKEKA